MKKDYTKTDRIILLLQAICKAHKLTLSRDKVAEILNVSRSNVYKNLNELLIDNGERKALLLEKPDGDGNIFYQLNHTEWRNYLDGRNEIDYTLRLYRKLGHLFPSIDEDGMSTTPKKLDRKFHYHVTIKAKNDPKQSLHLEAILKALVANKKVTLNYKSSHEASGKGYTVLPLTIVQYRDDLYLVGYKDEIADKNIRMFKISRIIAVHENRESFKYPNMSVWDPEKYFANTSGIIVDSLKDAHFKVYGNSRYILAEKDFFDAKIINSHTDCDEYMCHYSNIEEFMGLLFIYGQDVEILGDKVLKKAFKEKAAKILERNK